MFISFSVVYNLDHQSIIILHMCTLILGCNLINFFNSIASPTSQVCTFILYLLFVYFYNHYFLHSVITLQSSMRRMLAQIKIFTKSRIQKNERIKISNQKTALITSSPARKYCYPHLPQEKFSTYMQTDHDQPFINTALKTISPTHYTNHSRNITQYAEQMTSQP